MMIHSHPPPKMPLPLPQSLSQPHPPPQIPFPPPQMEQRMMIQIRELHPLLPPHPHPQEFVEPHPQFVADKSLIIGASKSLFMLYSMWVGLEMFHMNFYFKYRKVTKYLQ